MDGMAGPLVTLRAPNGTPLLAWGSDTLRVNPGSRRDYKAVVLTAEGLQDPNRRIEGEGTGVRVLRCGYLDNGSLPQAQAAVERCAPTAAAWVAAGIPTLVLCAAGENRSALMTARIQHLVTGATGASIVTSMRTIPRTCSRGGGQTYQAPPGTSCTFSNGVFRRWAQTWQSRAPMATLAAAGQLPRWLAIGGGVVLALVAVGLVVSTLRIRPGAAPAVAANRRRRRVRQRTAYALAA
jgi:hypothetical protein